MNAQWKEIKNNDELIQEKIENYLTKQKVDLVKNTLMLWKKQSNVNVSSDSNLIILDEGASSTSAATPSTSSSTTNNEIFEKKFDILGGRVFKSHAFFIFYNRSTNGHSSDQGGVKG